MTEDKMDTELYALRDLIASHIVCEADCKAMPTGCGCALTAARAVLNRHAQLQSDSDDAREPTPHWQRRWPHDQPNGWNLDSAGFLKLVQEHPLMWLALGRAKYLELRIDTRDGGFNLYDRDKKPLNPDDVIEAINKVRKDFGDTALSSTDSESPHGG